MAQVELVCFYIKIPLFQFPAKFCIDHSASKCARYPPSGRSDTQWIPKSETGEIRMNILTFVPTIVPEYVTWGQFWGQTDGHSCEGIVVGVLKTLQILHRFTQELVLNIFCVKDCELLSFPWFCLLMPMAQNSFKALNGSRHGNEHRNKDEPYC